jgi:ankyrin repeat protein
LAVRTYSVASALRIARLLIEHGSEIDARDNAGLTPLFSAIRDLPIRDRDNRFVWLLLEAGADTSLLDSDGISLLFSTCRESFRVISKLLSHRTFATCPYDFGPPYMRGFEQSESMIRLLMEVAGNVDIRDNAGRTLLMMARHREDEPTFRRLIAAGADIHARDDRGDTVLFKVVRSNSENLVRFLLVNGADVNARNNHQSTPLMEAALCSRFDIVHLLLQAGAEVNARDQDQMTALMFACRHGNEPAVAVRLLLLAGAEVNACDRDQRTALMEACYRGAYGAVEALLDHHADIHAKDKNGNTAISIVDAEEDRDTYAPVGQLLRRRIAGADVPLPLPLPVSATTEAAPATTVKFPPATPPATPTAPAPVVAEVDKTDDGGFPRLAVVVPLLAAVIVAQQWLLWRQRR